METGYFFCGDLLGFGKIIENLDAKKADETIDYWVKCVRESALNNDIKKYQLISDTVFAAVNNDKENLNNLINFARELLNICVPKSLLLRGGIVCGEYNFVEHLVYGKAVIKAHDLEKEQDWIGVVVDITDNLEECDFINMGLTCYPAPMHNKPIKLYPAINWEISAIETLSTYSTDCGLTNKGEILYWGWGKKIQNTILFNLYRKFIEINKLPPNVYRGVLPIHWVDQMMHNPIGKIVSGSYCEYSTYKSD